MFQLSSIIYVISGLREACVYMSLREACEKFARVFDTIQFFKE